MADRPNIRGCTANPEFGGSVRAEDGGQVFVYNGRLDVGETGEFVVARGPNVVLEVIDSMAARDRLASRESAARRGAVHVELRPEAATHLAALLLAHPEGERAG